MLILSSKKVSGENLSSQITDQKDYDNRRLLIKSAFATLAATNLTVVPMQEVYSKSSSLDKIKHKKSLYKLNPVTNFSDVTSYNNFYEFGTGKSDPSKYAPKLLKVDPWSVEISGLVLKEKTISDAFIAECLLKETFVKSSQKIVEHDKLRHPKGYL